MSENLPVAKRTAGPLDQVKALIQSPQFVERVTQALPAHCTSRRFLQVALTCLNKTPKLAECSQSSLFEAFLTLSSLGLEPDGRRAHLLPFGNKVTLIIDYKGLVELLMRSGEVSKIHADVVRENDEFEYDLGEIKRHKINFRIPDRGKVYAVYAMVTLRNGTVACAVMGVDEVERIRKRSFSPNSGPWVTDWDEMAKKTVFKRLTKWLSLSPELRERIEKDTDIEDDVTISADAPPSTPPSKAQPTPAAGLLQPPQVASAEPQAKRGPGRPPKSKEPVIDVPSQPAPQIPKHQAELQAWMTANSLAFEAVAQVLSEFSDSEGKEPYKELSQVTEDDWGWIQQNAEAILMAMASTPA